VADTRGVARQGMARLKIELRLLKELRVR